MSASPTSIELVPTASPAEDHTMQENSNRGEEQTFLGAGGHTRPPVGVSNETRKFNAALNLISDYALELAERSYPDGDAEDAPEVVEKLRQLLHDAALMQRLKLIVQIRFEKLRDWWFYFALSLFYEKAAILTQNWFKDRCSKTLGDPSSLDELRNHWEHIFNEMKEKIPLAYEKLAKQSFRNISSVQLSDGTHRVRKSLEQRNVFIEHYSQLRRFGERLKQGNPHAKTSKQLQDEDTQLQRDIDELEQRKEELVDLHEGDSSSSEETERIRWELGIDIGKGNRVQLENLEWYCSLAATIEMLRKAKRQIEGYCIFPHRKTIGDPLYFDSFRKSYNDLLDTVCNELREKIEISLLENSSTLYYQSPDTGDIRTASTTKDKQDLTVFLHEDLKARVTKYLDQKKQFYRCLTPQDIPRLKEKCESDWKSFQQSEEAKKLEVSNKQLARLQAAQQTYIETFEHTIVRRWSALIQRQYDVNGNESTPDIDAIREDWKEMVRSGRDEPYLQFAEKYSIGVGVGMDVPTAHSRYETRQNENERLKSLIENGISPDIANSSGEHLVHIAARRGSVYMARALYTCGADLRVPHPYAPDIYAEGIAAAWQHWALVDAYYILYIMCQYEDLKEKATELAERIIRNRLEYEMFDETERQRWLWDLLQSEIRKQERKREGQTLESLAEHLGETHALPQCLDDVQKVQAQASKGILRRSSLMEGFDSELKHLTRHPAIKEINEFLRNHSTKTYDAFINGAEQQANRYLFFERQKEREEFERRLTRQEEQLTEVLNLLRSRN